MFFVVCWHLFVRLSNFFTNILTHVYWVFFDNFLSSAIFFKEIFFRNTIRRCQTDLIQIRPDVLSGLIWLQTVCKINQQTTIVGKLKTEQPAQGIWVRQTPAFHTQNPLQNRVTIDQTAYLTLKAARKNASEYVVC